MDFIYDDGGRKAAGFKGTTGDCAARAIAIATQKPYQIVYDEINAIGKTDRLSKRRKSQSSARSGVFTATMRRYMASIGWHWIPAMFVGQGCRVHLKAAELPIGPIVVALSKHYAAVIDRVLHDLSDCSRNETRCVYGYYIPPASKEYVDALKACILLKSK